MLQPGVIFNWDTKTQGLILGAFFYGYVATNVVGGMIAQKVGGKLLMLFGVFWTAFLTLLTPVFTTLGGFGAIFAVRLLEGLGEVSNDIDSTPCPEKALQSSVNNFNKCRPVRIFTIFGTHYPDYTFDY